MKTLIFEGIVTSAKSTLAARVADYLTPKMKVELVLEDQTHIPIMDQRNDLHLSFFKDLIARSAAKQPDVLIFDRLYITQAHRAHSDLAQYSSVEDALAPYSPHTIILKVDEAVIADRIKAAAEHRGKEWQDFWKTYSKNFDEIAQKYIEQQRNLLELVKQSRIPYSIFDTTNHNYDEIVQKIIEII